MLIRVGNVWYPNTAEWKDRIELARRSKHRAFISEKNKRAHRYKCGGRPPLVELKWPEKAKP